jgi:hypothetical protein
MTTSTINSGTLVFGVYDLASRQLAWKGYAQKTLNPSKNPEAAADRLQYYPRKRRNKELRNGP